MVIVDMTLCDKGLSSQLYHQPFRQSVGQLESSQV